MSADERPQHETEPEHRTHQPKVPRALFGRSDVCNCRLRDGNITPGNAIKNPRGKQQRNIVQQDGDREERIPDGGAEKGHEQNWPPAADIRQLSQHGRGEKLRDGKRRRQTTEQNVSLRERHARGQQIFGRIGIREKLRDHGKQNPDSQEIDENREVNKCERTALRRHMRREEGAMVAENARCRQGSRGIFHKRPLHLAATLFRMTTSSEAKAWIKANKHVLVERFASLTCFPPEATPLSIFMAGSPGAGKTEIAHAIVQESNIPIVHVDADAIRAVIPGFDGKNASIFQEAATVGVDKLYDYALKHRQSVLLDTTFTPYPMVRSNVERSVRRNRPVIIMYIYQKPEWAWKFTKARERIEGRVVPREAFIRQFLDAPQCADRIHDEFPKKVALFVFRKDLYPRAKQRYFERVKSIRDTITIPYNQDDMERLIR